MMSKKQDIATVCASRRVLSLSSSSSSVPVSSSASAMMTERLASIYTSIVNNTAFPQGVDNQ